MRKWTEAEIREMQEKKNAANVAGLLMANPPKAHNNDEGGKSEDDVQGRTDSRR